MKKMMIATLAAASVLLAVANQAHAGATLDAVQKKGFVQCGISDGLPGQTHLGEDFQPFALSIHTSYLSLRC